MSKCPIEEGKTYGVAHPFIRERYVLGPTGETFGDEMFEPGNWYPGFVFFATQYEEGKKANGIGSMLLTVHGIYKPGRYQTRVFYVRKWRDPDGKEFGSGRLRVASTAKFRSLAEGRGAGEFRPYEYTVDPDEDLTPSGMSAPDF